MADPVHIDLDALVPDDSGSLAVDRRDLGQQITAVSAGTVDLPEIGPWISAALGRVAAALGAQGVAPVGPPFARYFPVGNHRFHVEAGFPTDRPVEPDEDGVAPSTLPAGPVAVTVHVGPYDGVSEAYARIATWAEQHGTTTSTDPWEIYLTDPTEQPDPSTWRTEVFLPLDAATARSSA